MSRIMGRHAQNTNHVAARILASCAALLILALAGCSGSPASTPTSPHFSSSELAPGVSFGSATDTAVPTASSAATTSDQPGGLTYIGTFTDSSPGSSITTKVSIGQPIPNTQGRPPANVLSACRWDDTTTVAQSVYIHGSLTISYTGSLPEIVAIAQPNLLNLTHAIEIGAGDEGPVSLQGPDGSWHACGTSSDWSYDLQPNSTVTVDMWIDYLALSNAHPVFSAADLAPLAINFAAGAGGSLPTDLSGPNAAKCTLVGDTTMDLLLYSTPPYTYDAKDLNSVNHIGTCIAA